MGIILTSAATESRELYEHYRRIIGSMGSQELDDDGNQNFNNLLNNHFSSELSLLRVLQQQYS